MSRRWLDVAYETEKAQPDTVALLGEAYICYAQTVDPGESMDCPAQTVDSRFAQTIHGLFQTQHDHLNTYPKPQRLQCRIPNPEYESLTSPCVADRSPSLWLRPSPLVCGTWLCVVQSMGPQIAQTIQGLFKVWIHSLRRAIHGLSGSTVCA